MNFSYLQMKGGDQQAVASYACYGASYIKLDTWLPNYSWSSQLAAW